MLISYKLGQGSIILRVKILNSSVATGAGLTGLTYKRRGTHHFDDRRLRGDGDGLHASRRQHRDHYDAGHVRRAR